MKSLFIVTMLTAMCGLAAEAPAGLSSPFYIQPRTGAQHIALSENWELSWRDNQVGATAELAAQPKWFKVAYPQ
ncbi:MAG: hypothetical protein M1541_16170, partial [Acidobacteria bacterium]|nr:hypothetical protein [Acidobacteriota bacterium]